MNEDGNALPGRAVELTLEPLPGTGGHAHETPQGPAAGSLSPTSLNTGADGIATVSYAAGVASGEIRVRAGSEGAREATLVVRVAVEALQLLGPDADYGLIGQTAEHPENHYGTSSFVTALKTLAREFSDRYQTRLEFNDMSLKGGGIFDIHGDYAPPHAEHRVGTNVDLRTRTLNARQLDFVRRRWELLSRLRTELAVHDETGTRAPHFHLRF